MKKAYLFLLLLAVSCLYGKKVEMEIVLTRDVQPFVLSEKLNLLLQKMPDISYSIDTIDNISMHPLLLENNKYDIALKWEKLDCDGQKPLPAEEKLCNTFIISKPVIKTTSKFYQRKKSTATITEAKDIYGKTVCRPQGWFLFDLEKYTLTDKITLQRPKTLQACFEALKNGTVDLVATTEDTAQPIIQEMGLTNYIESVESLSIPIEFSLMSYQTHPKGRIYIHRFNQALEKLNTKQP